MSKGNCCKIRQGIQDNTNASDQSRHYWISLASIKSCNVFLKRTCELFLGLVLPAGSFTSVVLIRQNSLFSHLFRNVSLLFLFINLFLLTHKRYYNLDVDILCIENNKAKKQKFISINVLSTLRGRRFALVTRVALAVILLFKRL